MWICDWFDRPAIDGWCRRRVEFNLTKLMPRHRFRCNWGPNTYKSSIRRVSQHPNEPMWGSYYHIHNSDRYPTTRTHLLKLSFVASCDSLVFAMMSIFFISRDRHLYTVVMYHTESDSSIYRTSTLYCRLFEINASSCVFHILHQVWAQANKSA